VLADVHARDDESRRSRSRRDDPSRRRTRSATTSRSPGATGSSSTSVAVGAKVQGVVARSSRGRDDQARSWRRASRAARSRASRSSIPRLTRPYEPLRVRRGARGRSPWLASERRGKYLLRALAKADWRSPQYHPRMTGRLRLAPVTHERAVVAARRRLAAPATATCGASARGSSSTAPSSSRTSATKNGPEPLGRRFTSGVAGLAARASQGAAQGRSSSTSASSRGLRNIYADEALCALRLGPLRPAERASRNDEVRAALIPLRSAPALNAPASGARVRR
jgi:hypothetical protein